MMTVPWATQLASALQQSSPRQVGGLPVVYPVMEELGVRAVINDLRETKADIDLGRLVEILTLNRLLAPQPLSHVGEWVESTVVGLMFGLEGKQLYDQRFGRGLDDLHPILAEAWVRLAAQAVQQEGLDISVLHWDTTSLQFAGEYADSEWVEYAWSRDLPSSRKKVKIGLEVTSRERVPLLYQLLAGATADVRTSVPQLRALATFLRRAECATLAVRPLVVGDCKMMTAAAVAAAHQHHLLYLGPWEMDAPLEALIRSVTEEEWAANELEYRPQRHFPAQEPFQPYRGLWRPFPVSVADQTYADRALVVWSAGKARLDADKRKAALKALLNRLADIQGHLNHGRYIRRDYAAQQIAWAQRGNAAKSLVTVNLQGSDRQLYLDFRLDRAALAQAQALDGKYVLGTNAMHLSASQALCYFKAQDGVEKSNRTLKGPLQVQPLYVHSDQRIEGLVFITLLALLVRALLELRLRRAGLRLSATQTLATFATLYATAQTFVDGSTYVQLGTVTARQQRVLEALACSAPQRYLARLPD